MRILEFDKNYPKLKNKVFTTVRDHDKKFLIDEEIIVKSPKYEFNAQIIKIEHSTLGNEPMYRLLDDLCLKSDIGNKPIDEIDFEGEDRFEWGHAYYDDRVLDEFKKIYPSMTWNSDIYIYTLKKEE